MLAGALGWPLPLAADSTEAKVPESSQLPPLPVIPSSVLLESFHPAKTSKQVKQADVDDKSVESNIDEGVEETASEDNDEEGAAVRASDGVIEPSDEELEALPVLPVPGPLRSYCDSEGWFRKADFKESSQEVLTAHSSIKGGGEGLSSIIAGFLFP
ncbi:hypothetical protein E1B28_000803 [Marasmius oreades]|uniref:Uncharacterized protein n=1 Tax=Marasmius oreades TaxID=181124 RepID=A0A9P7V232_9AGAR|nr:uncharacterized protein E1B28_000803 [Marasmius oreades]KAG7098903.1 hypothetical protein E1B28_000803 [Marasmius oreades]